MMNTPLKYPGAKTRITDWVISFFPEHHTYLELFLGGASILLNKSPSRIETVNDLDDDVINLFRLIREAPDTLAKAIAVTPYARAEYDAAYKPVSDPVEKARRFLVRSWQGYGYRANKSKVGWKSDVYAREAAYTTRTWNRVPDWIRQTAERLKAVQIEKQDAIQLAGRYNHENVLIYADPPYVHSTRSGPCYNHEMTDEDHVRLLEALLQHKGPVILSGYQNPLYREMLKGWHTEQIANMAEQSRPRTETLWMNFEHQMRIAI